MGHSTSGADLLGHLLEALKGTTGQVNVRLLASEGAGHRVTYSRSRTVYHGVLVFEQHADPLNSSIQEPSYDILRSESHCGQAIGGLLTSVNIGGELVLGQRERFPVAVFAYTASPWGCALGLMF